MRDENGAQLLLSATAFRRKGEDQYYPEFNTPQQNFGVAHNLDYERGSNVFIKGTMGPFALSLAHVERERGIPTASFGQSFNDPRARTTDTQTDASLTYQNQLNDDTTMLARLFWGQHVYEGVYADDTLLNLDSSKSSWAGTELSLLTTHWRDHKVLAGVEFQRDYQRDQFNADEYPAGSPDAPVFSAATQRIPMLDAHNPGSRAGVYLQDEITLRDNLLLNIGARVDYNSEASGAFSPRIALIYKPQPATTLKAIAGSAFRAPNAYELYYQVQGAAGQLANPDLKPERIRSNELVLEHQFDNHAHLTVSAFRNAVSDLISIAEDENGNTVFRNLSRATAKGLELEYEQVWHNGVKLRASQSWQKATDNDTGTRLTNSPPSLTKLNLLVPVFQNRATAGLEAHYVGPRDTLQGSVDGYWLANATLFSARLIGQCDVSLSVYNLFDRQYDDPGATEHRQNGIPQPGRAYRIKISRSF
jgi:iron complex outermembrane receptor protein